MGRSHSKRWSNCRSRELTEKREVLGAGDFYLKNLAFERGFAVEADDLVAAGAADELGFDFDRFGDGRAVIPAELDVVRSAPLAADQLALAFDHHFNSLADQARVMLGGNLLLDGQHLIVAA